MKETKSVKLCLLIRPSLFKRLKESAWLSHTSVNNLIGIAIEEHISKEYADTSAEQKELTE